MKKTLKRVWATLQIIAEGLSPKASLRSPMRAIVWAATIIAILWALAACLGAVPTPGAHALVIAGWVSLTLLLTVVCEAVTEGFSREQTANLKATRDALKAWRIQALQPDTPTEEIPAAQLAAEDLVIVRASQTIPSDGEVVAGVAAVDESALTGESAPVIREADGDRSTVTAGTRVLSDWIIVRVRAVRGESFLDKMIAMVENGKRQKTPTEISMEAVLTIMTFSFLALAVCIAAMSSAWAQANGTPNVLGVVETIGLFLCLSPTTIGALLPVVGIAGMLRLMRKNVIAKSAQAVEAAGNVEVMLMDKTGTITLGDRQAREFYPRAGVAAEDFAREAQLSSIADKTPEGRSVVILAKENFGLREQTFDPVAAHFVEFSAHTKMSGVDLPNKKIRKGAATAVGKWLKDFGMEIPDEIRLRVAKISHDGGTPLVLADDKNGARGVIALRDVVKGGLKERFAVLRNLKIETVMVTGDNALTAASVAAEAGVDRFVAEATPEQKLTLIRQLQAQGHTVAMSGDGSNDAPALAQADVALAMNSGTQPAKEAGNLIDLDSNPTKLIEVVQIGKQNLITVGALTTFSLANDTAKFFTLLPAVLAGVSPALKPLDVIGFESPAQAMTVALIFNAIIIPLLLPLALAGTPKPRGTEGLLLKHILLYGVGGAIAPFIIMKLLKFIC